MPEIAAAPRVYHHPDLAGMLRNVIYFAGEGRPDFLLLFSQNRPWQKWSGAESRSSASYVVFLLPADKKVPLMKAWKEACLVIGLLLVIEKWTGVVEGSTSTILIALREKHATEIPALTFGFSDSSYTLCLHMKAAFMHRRAAFDGAGENDTA